MGGFDHMIRIDEEADLQKTSRTVAPAFLHVLIIVSLACGMYTCARLRLIDWDEGFYLLASKLIIKGKRLYGDFLFSQMPLSPYVYAAWMKLAGETWGSARSLAAVFAAGLGYLLYRHVLNITRSWTAAAGAVLLYITNTFVIAWFSVVKTYALSTLLLFGAYVAISRAQKNTSILFAGILLGLSIDTRLFLVVTVPLFLAWLYRCRAVFPNVRGSYASFFLGLCASLSPNIYWIIQDPGNFLFDNFGYHAIRSDGGLVGAWGQKIQTLLAFVGLHPSPEGNTVQVSILLLLCICAVTLRRDWSGSRAGLSMWIAAAIIVVSTLPTPTYQQYYCVAVPFLIVSGVTFAWSYARSSGGTAVLLILLALYVAAAPVDAGHYFWTGTGVPAVDRPVNFRQDSVRSISLEVSKLTKPGEAVLTFWPGYLVESTAESVPGMESGYGLLITSRLSPAERLKYKLRAESEIASDLARHEPRVVILGNGGRTEIYQPLLERFGYHVVFSAGDTSIYVYAL